MWGGWWEVVGGGGILVFVKAFRGQNGFRNMGGSNIVCRVLGGFTLALVIVLS